MENLKTLVSVKDLTGHDLSSILNIVQAIDTKVNHYMEGKILATIFFEPSTRTKLSFHTAMYKLGGRVIDLPHESSMKKGESQLDTIKTISEYADIIVVRHPEEHMMEEFARCCKVPLINAGNGSDQHPTQALTDFFTIGQFKKGKKEITIMFTGDLYYSRVVNSLVALLDHLDCGIKFIFTNEINFGIKCMCDQELHWPFLDHKIIEEEKIEEYLPEVDVLYMTRPQKERYDSNNKIINTNFVLTKDLTFKMKADGIIMHPLPRNEEIHPDVDENYRAKYFQQVKNGVYIRMALIKYMLQGRAY